MEQTAPATTHNKDNPFLARLTENRELNQAGSKKDTRHFCVDITGSGLTYECGDSLGVYPQNRENDVEALMVATGFSGEELVQPPKLEITVPVREAFRKYVALAAPQKKILQALQGKVTDPAQSARIETLLDRANAEETKSYLANRELADLLEDFPGAKFEPQELVDLMRRLIPRLYSIASSPAAKPNEVELTVAVVRYRTNDRDRVGVASTWLAERCPLDEPMIPVYIQKSHFGLPEEKDADLIMVGPGTGIAPFRSFIIEKAETRRGGRSWLFFGDQHRATDYLYGEEWEEFLKDGRLDRIDLAFSRDQEHKIYVQDKMREQGAELFKWLEGGGYFFVCGDASRMAKDVDQALHEIIAEHGGMSEADAKNYLKNLRKEKRYQKDVY